MSSIFYWFLSLGLLLALEPIHSLGDTCNFPGYLQGGRGDPERQWYSYIEHDHGYRRQRYDTHITFSGSRMEVRVEGVSRKAYNRPPTSYTQYCVLEITTGQFLARHREPGASIQQYLCIEFIKRTDALVQIRASNLSNSQSPNLCQPRRTSLLPRPLVRVGYNHVGQPEPEACPLDGGFKMVVLNRDSEQSYCIGYDGRVRLESNCMPGEGMYFRFGHEQCIPQGLNMRVNQQTRCVGSWINEGYQYTVLQHPKKKKFWCMRLPLRRSRDFSVMLFKDLLCDSNKIPADPKEYLAIDLVRDEPRSISQLCEDEFAGCEYRGDPCLVPESHSYLACAKTCGVCSANRPVPCLLPPELRGDWLETNRNGTDTVEINDGHLAVYGHANFRCIQWDERRTPGMTDTEQMFVTTFDNGCRPRYTCGKFRKHSASVLRYQLSQSQIWPFTDVTSKAVNCNYFNYADDDAPFLDTYHSQHFKVLLSLDERLNVPCGLDVPLEFDLLTSSGYKCRGVLTHHAVDSRLSLQLPNCGSMPQEIRYRCLDTTGHTLQKNHPRLLILENLLRDSDRGSRQPIHCWLFPISSPELFYEVPLPDCNKGVEDKIAKGVLAPLLTFYRVVPTTPTTTTTTTTTITTTTTTTPPTTTTTAPKSTTHPDWHYEPRDKIFVNDVVQLDKNSANGPRKSHRGADINPDLGSNPEYYNHPQAGSYPGGSTSNSGKSPYDSVGDNMRPEAPVQPVKQNEPRGSEARNKNLNGASRDKAYLSGLFLTAVLTLAMV